jgi:hypothetical protein
LFDFVNTPDIEGKPGARLFKKILPEVYKGGDFFKNP